MKRVFAPLENVNGGIGISTLGKRGINGTLVSGSHR